MKRLTKKTENGFVPKYERETNENYYDLVSKLGQLEDIEEELGIDLVTLLKALKNGVYIKGEIDYMYGFRSSQEINKAYVDSLNWHSIKCYVGSFSHSSCSLQFKDYGKLWALDKQTLERK